MPKRPRHLSPEEEALWENVKKTAAPMHPARLKTQERPSEKKHQPKKSSNVASVKDFKISAKLTPKPSTSVNLAPDVADRLRNASLNMDRKTYQKLSKGKLRPEGRLDLHGMTLNQAKPALIQFVLAAHAAKKRLVLVITGKGKSSHQDEGPIPRKRGVLRDQVPRWLSSGVLSGVVQQVSHAHQSHGGDGAIYVYLRRSRT